MQHEFSHLILTDTGPVVAMIDSGDRNHDRCWQAMANIPESGMVTPTASLVEILYLLGKAGGHPLQRKLWNMIESGILRLRPENMVECLKAGKLMEIYSDTPMDFADGIVVVTADAHDVSSIFTIDRHFHAYRRSNGNAFTIIPG